jgi:hypothetical protein
MQKVQNGITLQAHLEGSAMGGALGTPRLQLSQQLTSVGSRGYF